MMELTPHEIARNPHAHLMLSEVLMEATHGAEEAQSMSKFGPWCNCTASRQTIRFAEQIELSPDLSVFDNQTSEFFKKSEVY